MSNSAATKAETTEATSEPQVAKTTPVGVSHEEGLDEEDPESGEEDQGDELLKQLVQEEDLAEEDDDGDFAETGVPADQGDDEEELDDAELAEEEADITTGAEAGTEELAPRKRRKV